MLQQLRVSLLCLLALPAAAYSQSSVRISEGVVTNSGIPLDYRGSDEDWIELHNYGSDTVDLAGWKIHDRPDIDKATELPRHTIAPDGRALVWATGEASVPDMYRLRVEGGSLSPSNGQDTAGYLALRVEGDFSFQARIYSFSGSSQKAKGGLMLRKDTLSYSEYMAALSDGNGDYHVARRLAQWDLINGYMHEIGSNYPDAWMRITRRDSIVRLEVAHLEGAWNLLAEYKTNITGASYVGLVAAGTEGGEADMFFGEVKLNDSPVDMEQHELVALKNAVTSIGRYSELHAEFSLSSSGNETVYLWNPAGELVDSMRIYAHPLGYSVARSDDGEQKGWTHKPTPGDSNPWVYPAVSPKPSVSKIGKVAKGEQVTVRAASASDTLVVYNTAGQVVATTTGEHTLTIDSGQVVIARSVRAGMAPSAKVYATYIIDDAIYHPGVPLISLAIDDEYLFSPHLGMFHEDNLPFSNESPTWLQVIDSSGALVVDHKTGTRIQGNATRTYAQKTLRLHAKGQYGQSQFTWPDFSSAAAKNNFKRLVLRNGGNDWNRAFMRDALASKIAINHVRADAADWHSSAYLFLNGAPYGVVNLRERLDERWFSGHYGVDEESISLFRDGPMHTKVGSNAIVQEIRGSIREHRSMDSLARLIDTDNFIDVIAYTSWSGNVDWGQTNQISWASNQLDGRLRWAFHDQDWSFGYITDPYANLFTDYFTDTTVVPFGIFHLMMEHDSLRRAFANRAADLANTRLHYSQTGSILQAAASHLRPLMKLHDSLYANIEDWEGEIASIDRFLEQRNPTWLYHLAEAARVNTEMYTVSITAEGEGHVGLNSLASVALPFAGRYFSGNPIELRAVPSQGWRFSHWQSAETEIYQPVLSVVSDTAIQYTAVFELDTTSATAAPVVINEIMYKPADSFDTKDFVELYNPNTYSVDLSGWVLRDDKDSEQLLIAPGTVIAPNSFLVFAENKNILADLLPGAAAFLANDELPFGIGRGDQVRLWDAEGALVDSVQFGTAGLWPAAADGQGPSLELLDHRYDNTIPQSWSASEPVGGTPGSRNSIALSVREVFTLPQLRLWPVPAADVLHVEIPPVSSFAVLELFSVDGRVLHTQVVQPSAGLVTSRINTEMLPPGGIYLRLRDAKGNGLGAARAVISR